MVDSTSPRRTYFDQHLIPESGKTPLAKLTLIVSHEYKKKLQDAVELSPATITRSLVAPPFGQSRPGHDARATERP